MLIRAPVEKVFGAMTDPEITSKFWFSRGSGPLEAGKEVRWDWEFYGVSSNVAVREFERNRRVLFEWWSDGEKPTTVEWKFTARPDGTTFLSAANWGFEGEGAVEHAIGSTEGFTLVLAGLKAYLEHGIGLTLVRDRFPDGVGGEA
ncbi:polyketide cyclase [Aquamicrobium sp. LC103]|nr:polyketide cyclase [Aquamicrobium sp. LC103]